MGLENGWQYVVPGYLLAFGLIGLYAVALIRRGKKLSRQLPEEERRFLD